MANKAGLLFAFLFVSVLAADVDRGKQLYQEGKYSEAERELRTAVDANAGDASANRLLGLALIEQGKAADAGKFIEKAHELDATPENKLALARLYVERKDYAKAEETLNGAEGDELEYVRGLVHLNMKRYEPAAADLSAFTEKRPDHAYAHYYAGLAYNGLKRPDRMLTHFQRFVELKPDAPEARKVRAVLKTGR